jgi:hypothetical protein
MTDLIKITGSQLQSSRRAFSESIVLTAIVALLLTVQLIAVAKYPAAFDAAFGVTAP